MNQKIGAILIIFLISMMSVSPIMATELSNETIIDNSINETDNIEINVSKENKAINNNIQKDVKSDYDENSKTLANNIQNYVKSADETDKGYFYITKFNNSDRPQEIESNNSAAEHEYGNYIPSGDNPFEWEGTLNKSMILDIIGEENYNNDHWSITNIRMDLIGSIIEYPQEMLEYMSNPENLENLFQDNNTQEAMITIIIDDYLQQYLDEFKGATYSITLDEDSPLFYPYVIKKVAENEIHVDGTIIYDMIFNIFYSEESVSHSDWFEIDTEEIIETKVLDNNTREITISKVIYYQQNHTLNTINHVINFGSMDDLRENKSTENTESVLTALDPTYRNVTITQVIYVDVPVPPTNETNTTTNETGNGSGDVPVVPVPPVDENETGDNDTNGTVPVPPVDENETGDNDTNGTVPVPPVDENETEGNDTNGTVPVPPVDENETGDNDTNGTVPVPPVDENETGDNDTNGTVPIPPANETGNGSGDVPVTPVPPIDDNETADNNTNTTINDTEDGNGTVIDTPDDFGDSQFNENTDDASSNDENESAAIVSMPKTGNAIAIFLIVLLFALIVAGSRITKDKNN